MISVPITQIIGKGGLAREIKSYFNLGDEVKMAEFEEIDKYEKFVPTIIAIGDPMMRKELAIKYHYLSFWNYNFGRAFSNIKNGKGNIICPGTLITVNVTLGSHVIINLNCTIGHDVVIGDYVTLSPGVNVSGNVNIGDNCYIGTNAVIREKINICSDVVIGAGSVVVKNIIEPGTYVGNPCKKIK